MALQDCEIYDLKKSKMDLDVVIDGVKADIQKATLELNKADAILQELTKGDSSYTKIKARAGKATQELDAAQKKLSKLESEYDQKLIDGKFEILEKVIVDRKVIRGPDFKLKWGSLMQRRSGASWASNWKELYGATNVTPQDKVWVQGAVWTGEYFKHGDAILMKIPLEVYIEKRRRETSKSNKKLAQQRRELDQMAKEAGSKLISKEEIADLGL